jgi:hypothetical protein
MEFHRIPEKWIELLQLGIFQTSLDQLIFIENIIYLFAILLQISCISFNSFAGVFLNLVFLFYFASINIQSFVDASGSNITRLPILMPMVCQDYLPLLQVLVA